MGGESVIRWPSFSRRFGVRLVAAMLLVSLPLMLVFAVSLTGLLAAGALTTTVDNAATRQAAVDSDPGSARFIGREGHDVIGGYAHVDDVGWTLISQDNASSLLAPVADDRRFAILIVILGAVIAAAVSIALAWRTTRPIRRLTGAVDRVSRRDLTTRIEPQGSSELVTLGVGTHV
jgi:methyl-accepting chemotaxis protein